MLRTFLVALVGLAALVLAMIFAALNPGVVSLDLGVRAVEVQKVLALAGSFALGWLFGLLCVGVILGRLWLQRRRLRRALRLAEAEIHALRRLPVQHAD
jgi:uncharacterized membrane protein YciS (DUF1049 family)